MNKPGDNLWGHLLVRPLSDELWVARPVDRAADDRDALSRVIRVLSPTSTGESDSTPPHASSQPQNQDDSPGPVYPPSVRSRFDALARISHPSLVRILEVYLNKPPFALISEFVEGTSLTTFIDSRGLSVIDAVRVLHAILLGLDTLHTAGIVHGRVTAGNIRIASRVMSQGFASPGVVKLAGLDQPRTKSKDDNRADNRADNRDDTRDDIRHDLRQCGELLQAMLTHESEIEPALLAYLGRLLSARDQSFDSAGTAADALNRIRISDSTLQSTAAAPRAKSPAIRNASHLKCTSCKAECLPGQNFCTHCGTQIVFHVRRCNSCGGFPGETEKFCTRCGGELAPPAMIYRKD